MRKKVVFLCVSIFVLALILVLGSAALFRKAKEMPPVEEQISVEEIRKLLSEATPEIREIFIEQCENRLGEQGYLLRDETISDMIAYIKETEPAIALDYRTMTVIAVTDKNVLVQMQEGEEIQTYYIKDVGDSSKEIHPGNQLYALSTTDTVLMIEAINESSAVLEAVWIKANTEGQLSVKYGMQEFAIANYDKDYENYEDIADIEIKDGGVSAVKVYTDKVNARLLSVKNREIELENIGTYPYVENIQVYKLFGEYEPYTLSDLKIGYAFTDFVLNDEEEIVAALVSGEGYLDKIRVVIKTTGFESAYHEEVVLSCDTDMEWKSGEASGVIKGGEQISIDTDCDMFKQSRITFVPAAISAKTKLFSVERNQGNPAYRGTLEIEKTSDGLLVINELSLDEYLYSVVPSEMPASYPLEALKAQAVSARTYAYAHMQSSRLHSYGAHVDDSAAFQVYNNIMESDMTTQAVRETEGVIVTENGAPVTTYFYSTSCGYGTDLTAWVVQNDAYLQAKKIGDGESFELTDGETFDTYIRQWDDSCYESPESYFRWKYETEVDEQLLLANLQKRYAANPDQVLTKTLKGYESKEINRFGNLQNIEIEKRAPGGAITQLLLVGSEATVRILSEKNVRYILAGKNTQLFLGENYAKEGKVNGMLPSAFLTIETEHEPSEEPDEEKEIVSYCIYGGGFGHGIGMSQNGARQMAKRGMTFGEILRFFYVGTDLMKMKKEEE